MLLRGKLNKSGLSGEQLVALIIILTTTFVAIMLILSVKNTLQGKADGECAAAAAQANFANKLYGREHALEIKGCNTKQITFKRSDFSGNDDKARKQVQHSLAENMRLCWSAWGAGKYDLFNGTGDYCHTCAVVQLEPDVQELFPGGEIKNFGSYLLSTKAPDGRTYQENLLGYTSEDSGLSGISNDPLTVSTAKPVAIVFWYAKEKEKNDALGLLLGEDTTPTTKSALLAAVASPTPAIVAASTAGTVLVPTTVAANLGAPAIMVSLVSASGAAAAATAALPAVITTAAVVYTGAYLYTRFGGGDDYYVLSATYIMPRDANSYYGQQCTQAASTPVSP